MNHDINKLSNRCAEETHTFTRTKYGCIVSGPLFAVPKYVAVGGSPAASEEAARKEVREIADLDVREVAG